MKRSKCISCKKMVTGDVLCAACRDKGLRTADDVEAARPPRIEYPYPFWTWPQPTRPYDVTCEPSWTGGTWISTEN